MRKMIAALALLALSGHAHAQSGPTLYIAGSGSDGVGGTNNCQTAAAPCATFAHLSEVTLFGVPTIINIANGQYTEQINLSHYKWWQIYGNCNTEGSVVLTSDWNRSAIWTQDHAVTQVQCLDITTNGGGSIAMQTRQFAISDIVDKVRIGYFPSGTLLYSDETSRINCAGSNKLILSNGGFGNGTSGASQMIYAHDASTVNMSCTFTATAPYQFTNTTVIATSRSLAKFGSFLVGAGSQPITVSSAGGYKIYIDMSEIEGVNNVPGTAIGPNFLNYSVVH